MPFAITLRLDDAAADRVSDLWHILAAQGLSHDAIRLGYPAHLTLAICPDDVPGSLLEDAIEALGELQAMPLTLSSLGIFVGQPAVVFLAPIVTVDLLSLHGKLLDALGDLPIQSHYRRTNWVPHVTLAKDIQAPETAIAAFHSVTMPITGILEKIEVIHFRPVRVLHSHKLNRLPVSPPSSPRSGRPN
jgi:2'-5' RNA ligase